MKRHNTTILLRLPSKVKDLAKAQAEATEITLSEFVRIAINTTLANV